MALFTVVMTCVGVAGMIGNVTSAGVNAGMSANNLRDEIKNIADRTADLQSKFNSIIKATSNQVTVMNAEITDNLDSIYKSHLSLHKLQENFIVQRRKIQMTGVIFILSIFFLLLLKLTGIVDSLNDLIMSPFTVKAN